MASGHVNRANRPNTWLHRPTLQNGKKVLANPASGVSDPLPVWVQPVECPLRVHVWTAPGWQELSSRFAALVGAAMCPAF